MSSSSPDTPEDAASEGCTATLVEEEERELGAVRLSTLRSYWDAVGGVLAAAVLLSVLLMQGEGGNAVGDEAWAFLLASCKQTWL